MERAVSKQEMGEKRRTGLMKGEQQGVAAEKGNRICYCWIKPGSAKLTPGSVGSGAPGRKCQVCLLVTV